jgi:hypothetical protein
MGGAVGVWHFNFFYIKKTLVSYFLSLQFMYMFKATKGLRAIVAGKLD